jgi:hypothetical protein
LIDLNLTNRGSTLENSSNLRLLQVRTLVWRILSRCANAGKPLDAILMSLKDRVADGKYELGGTMKNFLIFALALMLLIPLAKTAFAAPAGTAAPAQMTRVPFKGTMQSTETYNNMFPTMFVTATGLGDATQTGRFAVSYKIEWNLLDQSTTETAYLIMPNGDSLQAKAVGQATEDRTPGMYNLIEIYTITGGTGRFAGASGTFTLKRLVSMTVGVTSSTFEGYMLFPQK